MRRFIKTVSAAVAAVMAVTMTGALPAGAEEVTTNNVGFNDVLKTLSYHLTAYYGFTNDEYYIGSEIPSYAVNDGEVELFSSTSYYPVYCKDEAIGVFYVYSNDDGGVTFSYTDMLADQLEQLAPSDNYCLLLDGETEYIVPETETYSLVSNHVQYTSASAEKTLIPIAGNKIRAADSKSLSVPFWNQTQNGVFYGLCWAGSMWSIGKYLTGISSYTPFTIADELGIDYQVGASDTVVKNAFSSLYGLSAITTGKPTNTQIMKYINSGTPLYMSMKGDNGHGHAMVLRGFTNPDIDNIFVLITMDPYGGTTRSLSSTTSTYSIKYSTETYTWNRTIIPQ